MSQTRRTRRRHLSLAVAISAISPSAEIVDTRSALGAGTAPGAATSAAFQVLGQGGVPTSGVSAMSLDITAADTTSSGSYLELWPDGTLTTPPPVDPSETDLPDEPTAPTDTSNGNAPDPATCDAGDVYHANSLKGRYIHAIDPCQSNYNNTSNKESTPFTAEAPGTVGINFSASPTAKLGNSVSATIPPHKTINAKYGVWRRRITGTSYRRLVHMAELTKVRAAGTVCLAVVVSLITGCTAHTGQESPGETPSVSTSPADSASAIDVTKAPPDISGSTRAFIRLAGRAGSEEVAVIKSIKAGTVAVATECNGQGKTTIVIGKLATYTIPCTTVPATTYNEIGLGSSKKDVKITVSASSGVHWGLSVGWRPGNQHPS
jgi:hypothetical protein